MQTKKTTLFFDSRFRDYVQYPTPNRFRIDLINPIKHVSKITLGNVMVRDIPFGAHWLFAVSMSIYGQGISRPINSVEYQQAVLGIFARNNPFFTQSWKLYRDTHNEYACYADFPGNIPILRTFELSINCANEIAGGMAPPIPAPIWDPLDPDPDMTLGRKNWYGTLEIEHYDSFNT